MARKTKHRDSKRTAPEAGGPRPQPTLQHRSSQDARHVAAFRLLIEYEGTHFSGWQKQGATKLRTVAGSLERALSDGGIETLEIMGAGRTDAGVHALGQVAHLHVGAAATESIDAARIQEIFDEQLPSDVSVRGVEKCAAAFHARHDAESRTYLYQISRRRSGLAKPFLWWPKEAIDLAKLETVWKAFEGFHDVSSFCDLEKKDEPRCRIDRCEVLPAGSLVLLRVTASHFIKRQVRRMVGCAVAVANGRGNVEGIARDLESPTDEARLRWSRSTAPASGLFLERVSYRKDEPMPPLVPINWVP